MSKEPTLLCIDDDPSVLKALIKPVDFQELISVLMHIAKRAQYLSS